MGLDGAQEKSMKQEGRGQSTTLTGGLLESETGPHELSAEFVYRCPGFQHDGPSPALGFVAFASSVGASLSWAPAVLGLFRAEIVSARLNPSPAP